MEIKYTAESFNKIWRFYLCNKKVQRDDEIPQDIDFRKSFDKQKQFAINYYDNRPFLSK